MIARREILLSIPLLVAAGGAFALKPRKRLDLLHGQDLEKLIPLAFAGWTVTPSNAVILPKTDDNSLSNQLYSQTVSRLYLSKTDLPMMLVVAYGDVQSDQLQLHRPEVCYTAVGFQISESQKVDLQLQPQPREILPVRELVATNNDRVEPILYWTRIGNYLPTSGNEQRLLKLKTEMQGYVADGVLVRISTIAAPSAETFASLKKFAGAMLEATHPKGLPALIGQPLAAAFHGQQA